MNAARVFLAAAFAFPLAATSAPQISTYSETSCAVVSGAACWRILGPYEFAQ